MGERSFEAFEDIAIHLGIFAADFETHFFAERARQVADHSGEPASAVRKRVHPRPQDFKVETMRKMGRAAVEKIELFHARGEELLAICEGAGKLMNVAFGTLREFLLAEGLSQRIQFLRQLGMMALEPLE